MAMIDAMGSGDKIDASAIMIKIARIEQEMTTKVSH
jgi:hypothetical protein